MLKCGRTHSLLVYLIKVVTYILVRGHRGRDCKVVGFTTTSAISAYHY